MEHKNNKPSLYPWIAFFATLLMAFVGVIVGGLTIQDMGAGAVVFSVATMGSFIIGAVTRK